MNNNVYTFIVAPLLGWAAASSLLFVAYLTWLEIVERRRNRRLTRKRQLLGLN